MPYEEYCWLLPPEQRRAFEIDEFGGEVPHAVWLLAREIVDRCEERVRAVFEDWGVKPGITEEDFDACYENCFEEINEYVLYAALKMASKVPRMDRSSWGGFGSVPQE